MIRMNLRLNPRPHPYSASHSHRNPSRTQPRGEPPPLDFFLVIQNFALTVNPSSNAVLHPVTNARQIEPLFLAIDFKMFKRLPVGIPSVMGLPAGVVTATTEVSLDLAHLVLKARQGVGMLNKRPVSNQGATYPFSE